MYKENQLEKNIYKSSQWGLVLIATIEDQICGNHSIMAPIRNPKRLNFRWLIFIAVHKKFRY